MDDVKFCQVYRMNKKSLTRLSYCGQIISVKYIFKAHRVVTRLQKYAAVKL